ncbi:dihydroxyacetone kinase subunit DhaK [Streptomyces sp. TRM66268-LWL]|uniref:Dihydroxyacetone kinase subunit DhaK n=1 Tax=Streptomyces polyasparticus TaxID=2767826 RepID=A0ABR7SSE9_9ACTN|nr:dihydroxyacetone kinase subunit DhaL [Streptomyces polyasparticus]MBC9717522.1 dihydroxyacetone kinase subunit DhaK [Streptomyces polyasparticus]
MKKLINDAQQVVRDTLEGLAWAHPEIALLEGETVAVRAHRTDTVAIVSGGGSGHEPAHAGYVGEGMLTAAVCGDVFASPSVDTILDTIRTVAGPSGVLLIVKSYTGDRLNFGLAAELARAEGIAVRTVTVGDDVALAADGESAGRRGLAGTVLVHKIAGAAAAAGASLDEVAREAEAAAAAVGTMGVALGSCTVPAAGRPGFELSDGELELGLGIHGEAGVRRVPAAPAATLVATLLEQITADRGLKAGDRVALLVNGLGGTPPMELSIVTRDCAAWLADRGLVLERVWTGDFLTALEMPGVSLSVLPVDDAMLARLDAPAETPAWPAAHLGRPAREVTTVAKAVAPERAGDDDRGVTGGRAALRGPVAGVCAALTEAEAHLTALDREVGDGDLGISLLRGSEAILRDYDTYGDSPAAVLRGMAASVRRAIGGTSGPLYAVLLVKAAAALEGEQHPSADAWADAWADALAAGTEQLARLGGAKQGDRTMLDALLPAAAAFRTALSEGLDGETALARAVEAADKGAAATAEVTARRGRSSYLGERALGHPDPGAVAVALWLAALAEHLADAR